MRWLALLLLLTTTATAAGLNQCAPHATLPYLPEITSASAEFNVPPEALAAMVMQESTARMYALNPELGAPLWQPTPAQARLGWNPAFLRADYGLTQLQGRTAWWLGAHYSPTELFQPDLNLRLGAKYLAQQYTRFNDWTKALEAYNAGEGDVLAGDAPVSSRKYAAAILNSWRQIAACEAAK